MGIIRLNTTLRTQRKKTAGLSLVEMAIILGIVGLVVGVIWVAAAQVYLNQQVKTTAQQVESIVHNVRAVFAEQGGITGGTASNINLALDHMKVFPLELRTSVNPTGNFRDIWDGTVQVFADDCAGNEGAATAQPCFGITYLDVPQSACVRLLSQTAQSGMGAEGVIVNGGALVAAPIKPSAAETACNVNRNSILWIFFLKDST